MIYIYNLLYIIIIIIIYSRLRGDFHGQKHMELGTHTSGCNSYRGFLRMWP